MNIITLKEELLKSELRPTYIFTGEELALQDIYIDKICELSGMQKVVIDELSNVYARLGAKSIVKAPTRVYVVRDDEVYLKEQKHWEKVKTGKKQGKNILILKYTNLNKRSEFYKAHEDIITEFGFVNESRLTNRVQALTGLKPEYCRTLVKMCGCNYGRIKNELENLNILSNANGSSLEQAYMEAIKSNVIHREIGDIIFDFTNAVVDRDKNMAYSLYEDIKHTDEGPVKLISVLYNSFRNLMIVQSTSQNERTEDVLGLSKGQIYVTSKKCGKYSIYEVVNAVKLLQKIESGIKTGKIDVNFALDYFLGVTL